MACPACPAAIANSSDRLIAKALAVSLALVPPMVLAQEVDPALKELIPDAALADPEGWAKNAPTAQTETATATDAAVTGSGTPADPALPQIDQSAIALPWPDAEPSAAPLASLPPDPDIATELAAHEGDPVTSPLLQGEEIEIGQHLALVFPSNLSTFPERPQFLARFRELSTLQKLDTDKDTIAQIAARARADRDLIGRLLRIYGYYDAIVTQTVGNADLANGDLADTPERQIAVRFDVVPGDRYRFGAIDLGQLADTGPDYANLRAGFGIKSGDPLDNDRIAASRDRLDSVLGETGYAFASVGAPDLLIDHKREEGDLTIPVAPGGKYLFGHVVSANGSFLSSRHLDHVARFKQGEVYRRSAQDDLKRAILATGLVTSVTVTPREVRPPAAAGQPGEVALDVAMVPGPLRTIAGSIGYETGDGARLAASWEHRNLFPPEGMLRVRAIAGTNEQLLGTTLRWNNFHGRDQVLTLDMYGNAVARTAYNARTVAFSATFEKLTTLLFQKPWVWSVGLETIATSERESSVSGQFVPRNTYFIGAVPLRGALDQSDNLLDPTRGWRAALRLSPEYAKQQDGPAAKYVRAQFDASAYYSVNDRVVLAGRVRFGSIAGTELQNIAPSRRFYAGGGGSVRGFGYQEIGPRDSANAPSGGRSLAEFSLETRISTGLLDGALQLVPFLDAGAVSETVLPNFHDIRYGAGLGLRYKTGFGPIRIDLGTPLNRRAGESRISLSVALGQAF